MNTPITAAVPQQQEPAKNRDRFSHKMKRLVHYITSKFKIMMFEIISRSFMLNTTISYLYNVFIHVSDMMRKTNASFQQNTAILINISKNNQTYIEKVNHNFISIDKAFDDSFQVTDDLSGIAKVSGDNLKAIHDIAELTNILALNASIEAARAGAAGKGFAVVAQEIRKHAATTKDAIETISQNIKQLIGHIESLSEKMNGMKEEVKEGKSLLQKLVELSEQENKVFTVVTGDIASLEGTFKEYEGVIETLNKTIEQSNTSRSTIEQMLILFQDNMDNIEKVNDSY
jgi:methyl-accepting chemotaxis protein